ncbi:hypothetical protein ACQ4PT_065019 [Festuca glaucescens]
MGAMGVHRIDTALRWLYGFETEDDEEGQDAGAVQKSGADEDWGVEQEKRGRKRKRPSSAAPCKRPRAATPSPSDSASASSPRPLTSWDPVPKRPRSGAQGNSSNNNNRPSAGPVAVPAETVAAAAAEEGTRRRRRRKKAGWSCHQCNTAKRTMVKCGRCREKIYCTFCVKKRYRDLSEAEVRAECPCCRGICSCIRCIAEVKQSEPKSPALRKCNSSSRSAKRKKKADPAGVESTSVCNGVAPTDANDHSSLISSNGINNPSVKSDKELNKDQMAEIETEAKNLGLKLSQMNVEQADCRNDERVFWY